jgi:hypothetical protein
MLDDNDFVTENTEVKQDEGQNLVAVLRSSRYEEEDLRRFALDKAVVIAVAGYGGPTGVLGDAKAYYDFLRGA